MYSMDLEICSQRTQFIQCISMDLTLSVEGWPSSEAVNIFLACLRRCFVIALYSISDPVPNTNWKIHPAVSGYTVLSITPMPGTPEHYRQGAGARVKDFSQRHRERKLVTVIYGLLWRYNRTHKSVVSSSPTASYPGLLLVLASLTLHIQFP